MGDSSWIDRFFHSTHSPLRSAMQNFHSPLNRPMHGTGLGQRTCFDKQYRPTSHNLEQRYVSSSTGRCRPLVVQAVNPRPEHGDWKEIPLAENIPKARKLAFWLVLHQPFRPFKPEKIPRWFMRWAWFTLALIWPFNLPRYSTHYPTYESKYLRQLWATRSPREYSLRAEQLQEGPVREITHSPYPRRLVIYNSGSNTWEVCSDADIIKRQRYVAISYRYDDVVPEGTDETRRRSLQEAFIANVEASVASLGESAYWIDLRLVEKTRTPEETSKDLFRMADVYRSAQFTLIMLCPPDCVTEDEAWREYGKRLWTLPEALLSRKLHYRFGNGDIKEITLHQLAIRAYANLDEESAIVNSYAGRDPLERLERLSRLKSALWRRSSRTLERLEANITPKPGFGAERVYALMGFFEHRIHPHFKETELQAFVRLSMANDNDRLVERMISFLPPVIPHTACWYAEKDEWGANLWDIEPKIQVVGMTENHSPVLGGCRAATIRWKNFPSVAFATQRSYTRLIANFLPNLFWELLLFGIILEAESNTDRSLGGPGIPGAVALLVIALLLMLFAPLLVVYGSSGRIVQARPWLVGVKGLVSAEKASELMYGGTIFALPRISYSQSGTLLAQTEKGNFRRGDAKQLKDLQPSDPDARVDDDLYSLIDTLSATIYYFRAARPPTVCLYTGRESGMGRFVLCSERCAANELHKETVVRMPWYISKSMRACDWVALG